MPGPRTRVVSLVAASSNNVVAHDDDVDHQHTHHHHKPIPLPPSPHQPTVPPAPPLGTPPVVRIEVQRPDSHQEDDDLLSNSTSTEFLSTGDEAEKRNQPQEDLKPTQGGVVSNAERRRSLLTAVSMALQEGVVDEVKHRVSVKEQSLSKSFNVSHPGRHEPSMMKPSALSTTSAISLTRPSIQLGEQSLSSMPFDMSISCHNTSVLTEANSGKHIMSEVNAMPHAGRSPQSGSTSRMPSSSMQLCAFSARQLSGTFPAPDGGVKSSAPDSSGVHDSSSAVISPVAGDGSDSSFAWSKNAVAPSIGPAIAVASAIHKFKERRNVALGDAQVHQAKRQADAFERAQQHRKLELEERERKLAMSQSRLAEAAERKYLLEEQPRFKRALSLLTMVPLVRFVETLHRSVEDYRERERNRNQFLPNVVIRIRRALRRARCRLLAPSITKPSIASLRFDKMLNLFSDAHLRHLIDNLQPKYYFVNETIIFMGSEDDEAYVLATGSADVMMGQTKVFTLKPGMSFGTVGMISGEPRTASIVAREPSMVWCITRSKFEAYGTKDNQVEAALAIVSELRQTNMRNVYKTLLDPVYLESFPSFHSVSLDMLTSILRIGIPKIVKAGQIVADPSMPPNEVGRWYLLRGMIRVSLSLTASISVRDEVAVREHLGRLVLLPRKKTATGSSTAIDDLQFDKQLVSQHRMSIARVNAGRLSTVGEAGQGLKPAHVVVVGEFSGPLLLNIAPMVLQEVSPFIVETVNGCDILAFTKENFTQQDPLDLVVMRQNCLNLHTKFMAPLTKQQMQKAFMKHLYATASSAISFQSSLTPAGAMSPKPVAGCAVAVNNIDLPQFLTNAMLRSIDEIPNKSWVYGTHDFIHFDPNHNLQFAIITKGELEGIPSCDLSSASPNDGLFGPATSNNSQIPLPFIWPPLHMMFFGSLNLTVRAKSRVDAVMISRGDFIKWLCDELSEEEVTKLVCDLAQVYVTLTQKRPIFSRFGIESGRNNSIVIAAHSSGGHLGTNDVTTPCLSRQVSGKTPQRKDNNSHHNSIMNGVRCGDDEITVIIPAAKFAALDRATTVAMDRVLNPTTSGESQSLLAYSPLGSGSGNPRREKSISGAIPNVISVPQTENELKIPHSPSGSGSSLLHTPHGASFHHVSGPKWAPPPKDQKFRPLFEGSAPTTPASTPRGAPASRDHTPSNTSLMQSSRQQRGDLTPNLNTFLEPPPSWRKAQDDVPRSRSSSTVSTIATPRAPSYRDDDSTKSESEGDNFASSERFSELLRVLNHRDEHDDVHHRRECSISGRSRDEQYLPVKHSLHPPSTGGNGGQTSFRTTSYLVSGSALLSASRPSNIGSKPLSMEMVMLSSGDDTPTSMPLRSPRPQSYSHAPRDSSFSVPSGIDQPLTPQAKESQTKRSISGVRQQQSEGSTSARQPSRQRHHQTSSPRSTVSSGRKQPSSSSSIVVGSFATPVSTETSPLSLRLYTSSSRKKIERKIEERYQKIAEMMEIHD